MLIVAGDPACRWYEDRQASAAARREYAKARRICAFIEDQFHRRLPITSCADALVNGDVLR